MSLLRDALLGDDTDFSTAPLDRALLLLAIPMVLEMMMESVFAVVDVFFVGKLGASAVTAVGLTEGLLAIVYALAMGLAMGLTAVVARRIGEKDGAGANAAAGQGLVLGIALAIVLGSIGVLFAPQLLAMMGADEEVRRIGTGYTRVLLGGEASVILLFLGNAAFRAAGNAAVAMRVLLVANALNIVLDPCFIFGLGPFPELGVTGAAVATTIGRGIGALLAIATLFSGKERLVLTLGALRPRFATMRTVVKLAAPAAFQYLAGSASWAVMARLLAGFGSQAVAGYTIAIRIVIFAILPAFGIANAAATLVGQSLGANDPDRAERAAWVATRYNVWLLGVVGVLFLAFAPPLVAIFTDDPVVRLEATRCLRIIALGFPIYGVGMVLTQAYNGAGDTWTPTWLNVLCFWVFELPLAWWLMYHTPLGTSGAYIAITAAFCVLAAAGWWLFRRGAWKVQRV